jgi:histone H1/5
MLESLMGTLEKKDGIASKILRIALLLGGILSIEKIADYFIAQQNFLVAGGIYGLSVIGLGIYFKLKMNASMFQVSSYIMVVIVFGLYILYTMFNPLFKESTMFQDLSLTPTNLEAVLSIFSLTYGCAQLFGGYILSKFKLYGYGAMIILGGIFIILQGSSATFSSMYNYRVAAGIFLSVSGIVISYYPATFWKKDHLNFVINSLLFVSIKLASVANEICFSYVKTNPNTWRFLLKNIGITIIAMSVIFVLFVSIFGKQSAASNVVESKSEISSGGDSILKEFFTILVTNKKIILLCLVHATAVMSFYFFRCSGYLVELLAGYYPQHADSAAAINLLNSASAYMMLIGSMLLAFISAEALIFVLCAIHVFSMVGLVFFAKSSLIVIMIAAIGSTCGWASHGFPPMIVGKELGHKKSCGMLFGALNISAMLIGSYVGQRIGMYYTRKAWESSGSIMKEGKMLFSGDNVIYGTKPLVIAAVIAAIAALIVWKFLKRENNANNDDNKTKIFRDQTNEIHSKTQSNKEKSINKFNNQLQALKSIITPSKDASLKTILPINKNTNDKKNIRRNSNMTKSDMSLKKTLNDKKSTSASSAKKVTGNTKTTATKSTTSAKTVVKKVTPAVKAKTAVKTVAKTTTKADTKPVIKTTSATKIIAKKTTVKKPVIKKVATAKPAAKTAIVKKPAVVKKTVASINKKPAVVKKTVASINKKPIVKSAVATNKTTLSTKKK